MLKTRTRRHLRVCRCLRVHRSRCCCRCSSPPAAPSPPLPSPFGPSAPPSPLVSGGGVSGHRAFAPDEPSRRWGGARSGLLAAVVCGEGGRGGACVRHRSRRSGRRGVGTVAPAMCSRPARAPGTTGAQRPHARGGGAAGCRRPPHGVRNGGTRASRAAYCRSNARGRGGRTADGRRAAARGQSRPMNRPAA